MRSRFFLLILILYLLPFSIYSQNEQDKKDKDKIEDSTIEEDTDKDNEDKDETDDGKKVKKDEKRFQFGIGIHVNSLSVSGMNDVHNIFQSIKNDDDYTYPGISKHEKDSIMDLSGWMQEDILLSYILRSQEYGFHLRILWNILIFEMDFDLLPMDYTYIERSNIMLAPMIGIRYPSFIMPYFMIGPNLNIGFENMDFGTMRNKINTVNNSMIVTPGLVFKTGLDFKMQRFSIGLYYQYRIKDFNEITYWYSEYRDNSVSGPEAVWNIMASQSRMGLTFSVYFL